MRIQNGVGTLILALLLAACGGGGGGGDGSSGDINEPEAVASALSITGADTSSGDLPDETELDSAPILTLSDEVIASLFAKVGDTTDIELKVDVEEGSALDAMLAKIVGSSTVFELDTDGVSVTRKLQQKKLSVDAVLSLNLGANLRADNFCIDIAARDDAFRISKRERVCIGLPDNSPQGPRPLANAGADRPARPGDTVRLVGAGNSPDSTISSFSWVQVQGPVVELSGADTNILSFIAPSLDADTPLVFRLTVRDGSARESSSEVRVLVLRAGGPNRPPLVEAGPNLRINGGLQVILRGDSRDLDGGAPTVLWSQTAGPNVELTAADTPTARFIAPDVGEDTTLTFQFSVSDEGGATATDTANVLVQPGGENANVPPLANAGPDRDTAVGATLTLSGAASNDQDGNIVRFSWRQIGGPPSPLSNPQSSNPSFVVPDVVGARLIYQLLVEDNQGATSVDSIAINVQQAVAGSGPVADAGPDQTVAPGSNVQLEGGESFNPDGGSLSFSWSQVGGPGVSLSDASSARPSFVAPMVANGTVLSFQLTVVNGAGQVASDQVDITLGSGAPAGGPVLSFGDAAQTVSEGAGQANVRLLIQPPSQSSISLPYGVAGTATAGADYVIPQSPLQIPAGVGDINLSLDVIADNASESNETIIITLGDPEGAELGGTSQHTLTLVDDDAGVAARTLLGITDEGQLLRFNSATPGSASAITISGIEATGQDGSPPLILDMDRQPGTGAMFLLTSDQRFYRLNPDSGVATFAADLMSALSGRQIASMAFNPCSGNLRMVTDNRENLRVAADGALIAVDTEISYAAGDPNAGMSPGIDSVAFGGCVGGSTTAFLTDTTIDVLTTLGNRGGNPLQASSGRLFSVGSFGLSVGGAGNIGFDVFAGDARGFAADSDGTNTDLLALDLQTGALTNLGRINAGLERTALVALAVLQ